MGQDGEDSPLLYQEGLKRPRNDPTRLVVSDSSDSPGFTSNTSTGLAQQGARFELEQHIQGITYDYFSSLFTSDDSPISDDILNESARMDVKRILGVDSTSNLERYLGLPPIVGGEKKRAFMSLKDKMVSRSQGWSIRSLSQGGKEVFCEVCATVNSSIRYERFSAASNFVYRIGGGYVPILVAKELSKTWNSLVRLAAVM
ncbi:hypothetical protein V6N13_111015 [Hibiscus sabdariffa]